MTWFSKSALDAELQHIIDGCASGGASAEIILLKAYSAGDNWTTVYTTNNIGSADIDETGTYWGAIADDGDNRRVTFNGATGTASASDSGGTLWLAIVNVVGTEVLAVTDETSDQSITNGNPLTFPSFYLQSNQPTQVP